VYVKKKGSGVFVLLRREKGSDYWECLVLEALDERRSVGSLTKVVDYWLDLGFSRLASYVAR